MVVSRAAVPSITFLVGSQQEQPKYLGSNAADGKAHKDPHKALVITRRVTANNCSVV